MVVHLVKLCVGADSVDDLESWVGRRVAFNRSRGLGAVHDHVTRMFPKRRDEILAGGSLYWVIKGLVRARQRVVGLEPVVDAEGVERCAILLDPPLVPTEAQPKRAFQGWRYLTPEDAPRDLKGAKGLGGAPELHARLAELGLL